LEEIKYFKYSY